ncbi:hypothetical protein BT96DRAFT_231375 [Gymnopus androsaceus JB14]|uniref:Uncharacterized protein n=1 Tax=Gymnopus androsaceus JB14 TaxID=1447944 RepID=A0A6A4H4Q3_9AGAR|nr:hypothetical protein BT96DRAFT_231375 [Gymnopus androsaceus JB14]
MISNFPATRLIKLQMVDDGDDEVEDDLPELPYVEQRIAFLRRNPPRAPSSEAAVENFRVAQEKKERFVYCGRPVTADKPLPATLMDPILCEFQYNLHNSVPETQDILIFRELRAFLTRVFKVEDERKAELIRILRQLVPLKALSCGDIGPHRTDGDLRASVEPVDGQDSEFMKRLHQFLYYAEEVKNESGTGGKEALVEAFHYWLEQIRLCLETIPKEHQTEINFPAILLTLIGPQLAVSAAAFAGSPNVETLVSIPLNIHSTNTETIAAGQRLVYSLRIALSKLFDYYSNQLFKTSRSNVDFPFRNLLRN